MQEKNTSATNRHEALAVESEEDNEDEEKCNKVKGNDIIKSLILKNRC